MENALRLDVRFFARSDENGPRTHYELARAIEGQNRFFPSYLGELIGKSFETVLDAAAPIAPLEATAVRGALQALWSSEPRRPTPSSCCLFITTPIQCAQPRVAVIAGS